MKLWLLRPIKETGVWEPWYDKCFGFVVRAKTEAFARKLAEEQAGDESSYAMSGHYRKVFRAWESPEHTTCVELTADGDPGIVIRDFASA